MQDPSDAPMPEESHNDVVETSDVEDSDRDGVVTTVLAEVLPGVAVVFGEVPAAIRPDLLDFGLVSDADRRQISTALASIVGNTATIVANLGSALGNAQGLYSLGAATQQLLNSGATLAVKDGANLGSVWLNGDLVAQARFIPVSAVSAAQLAAAIGPAVAMIGLQMQLNEITGLVRTNIALTSQVLTVIRHEHWAELSGLVTAIDRALDQAREVGSVPASLWETVAGSEAALRKQLDLYRTNVGSHVKRIDKLETQRLREYLDANAEAIIFDSHALMSSLKAWTAFQALRAGRARTAGSLYPDESQLVEIIARDTRSEFTSDLAEATRLVSLLTRELRIIAELPGRSSLPLTRKRKDSKVVRFTSDQLLKAIEPLAAALQPAPAPVKIPRIVAAPQWLEAEPYLRILRWFLEEGETIRALGFPYQLDAVDYVKVAGRKALPLVLGPIVGLVKGGLESVKWTEAIDRAAANTVVAVTDRRIISAKARDLVGRGDIAQEIPLERVRYVRAAVASGETERSAIDLITRDESLRWLFHADTEIGQVGALAALLAESMAIPDEERTQLLRLALDLTGAVTIPGDGG